MDDRNNMDRVRTLTKLAKELNRQEPLACGLPASFFFTDARRTPDLTGALSDLPAGTGVVFRHYESADRAQLARSVANLCRQRGLPLFIAGDAALARRTRADGLHLPEHMIPQAPAIRAGSPARLISAACHSEKALRQAYHAGIDLAFLSPLFPTNSHPGAKTLSLVHAARLVRLVDMPVYGLGGIGPKTARRLRGTGIAGIGAIEGLLSATCGI